MARSIYLQYGLVKDSNVAHSLTSAFFIMSFQIIIKNYEALKRLLFQGGGIKPGIGKSVLYFFIFADL